jgi:hypothetical protein
MRPKRAAATPDIEVKKLGNDFMRRHNFLTASEK